MTNFRKAVKNLLDSNLSDEVIKELLQEMLCPCNEVTFTDAYWRKEMPWVNSQYGDH